MKEQRFEKVVNWEGKNWFLIEIVILLFAVFFMIKLDKTSPFFWMYFGVALLSVAGMEGNLSSRKSYWRKI